MVDYYHHYNKFRILYEKIRIASVKLWDQLMKIKPGNILIS
jgi:hypothetical protein